jgi:hypothetical protein
MKATVIWIDDRTPCFEGELLGADGFRYYFNYSTAVGKPQRGQIVEMKKDTGTKYRCAFLTVLYDLKFIGGK